MGEGDTTNKEIVLAGKNLPNIRYITRKDGLVIGLRTNRDRFFYPGEWGKFYDKLTESQKFTFKFLINTGARITEARHVKVEDCDIERKRIVLRVTKVKAKKGEKYSRPRIIPISTQFSKDLKKYFTDNNLQPGDTLKILSTPAAHIAMKKTLQKAEIADWYMFSIHNVRKTLEVWLMSLGVDALPLTAHLGHDINTAAAHYVSPDVFSFQERSGMRIVIGDLYESHQKW